LKKWKAWNRIKKFLNVMEYKKWLFNRSWKLIRKDKHKKQHKIIERWKTRRS
jgi:hypothetical protein